MAKKLVDRVFRGPTSNIKAYKSYKSYTRSHIYKLYIYIAYTYNLIYNLYNL